MTFDFDKAEQEFVSDLPGKDGKPFDLEAAEEEIRQAFENLPTFDAPYAELSWEDKAVYIEALLNHPENWEIKVCTGDDGRQYRHLVKYGPKNSRQLNRGLNEVKAKAALERRIARRQHIRDLEYKALKRAAEGA